VPSAVARWTSALVGALLAGPLLAGCTSTVPGSAEYAPPGAEGHVVREPCPDPEFECITLGVPADHFAAGSPTWEVTFALHRGSVDSRGVVVTATGGPGGSGLAEAADRLAGMSPEITDHYDLVFFDQRGVGRSEPFRCDRTLAADDSEVLDSGATAAQRDTFAEAATQLALDCFAEAGVDPADAGRYATRQAVEDLESFRDWLDADQLVLYGESYGTQFQQVYAAAHPDRVAALVLDGVVDLSTDDLTFGIEAAGAYSSVLAATLSACDRAPACAGDAPGSALAQYDALVVQLTGTPLPYDFPLADGSTEARELTVAELQGAATWSMSDPWSREQFQQALNAVVTGNVVPMARLAAAAAGADAETGVVADDPSFSTATYFAVQCADYDLVPASSTGRAQLDVWLGTAAAAGTEQARLGDLAHQDLPCLFWPETGATPPAPAAAGVPPYPVLVLTADTDPNTPTQQAERVFARLPGSAIVVQQGGPHVVYGRGVGCVDQVVEELVTTGRLTPGRTTCPGPVAEAYWQNAPTTAAGYGSADEVVAASLDATLGNVGFTWWVGTGELLLGCDAGGTARYDEDGDTLTVTLADCAWTPDVPLDGSVTVTGLDLGSAHGELTLPFAELTFDGDSGSVSGTFRGAPVG
jgi:pimeloyl-ACP methyl ester carboxylesterase